MINDNTHHGTMNKKLLILFFAVFIGLTSGTKPKFECNAYGNVANYFESENDLKAFFDFHEGDMVAEVGAGNGGNMPGFSIVTDGVTFYVQDIDSIALSQTNFNKVVKQCKKIKKQSTNKFYRCIGTFTQTNLPDNSFDKILLISTFHEFTFMDEMMIDIRNKLKSSGQLYILEAHCFTLTHKNYTASETVEMMKKYSFVLVKNDGKDVNNSSGMYRTVFKKM